MKMVTVFNWLRIGPFGGLTVNNVSNIWLHKSREFLIFLKKESVNIELVWKS
jgi:hypothetical protein